ncbi:MAG: bifunctional diguanylate cyclase/phosphodiesterase [bacterium]
MDNVNNMNNINSSAYLLDILNKFYSSDDSKLAILEMFKEACTTCSIDKLTILTYNYNLNKYLKMYEYTHQEGLKNYSKEMNIEMRQCINILSTNQDKDRKVVKDLVNERNYLYTDDYSSIKDCLEATGFECKHPEKIKSIYIFLASSNPELFTYSTFEIYKEEKLNDLQLEFITALCNIINDKLNMLVDIKKFAFKLSAKEMSLDLNNGEESLVVDKDTYAVDSLTQSLLIKGFHEYYKSFIKRNNYNYALCSIDIDKFKYINSMFGYDIGDEVLKKISVVIKDFMDMNENFCRIGEDKFCMLLNYEDEIQLHLKLSNLANQFELMRDEYFSDAKITIIGGVTLVDKSLSLNTLLDQATTARKSAKGSHKNKFAYYNPELDLKLQKEIKIEERIPHAVANNEFVAFLQPKFDLTTKKICGAEALVRWITPDGMIFPDQFIPLFEKNGFILTLDFIVYKKVMKFIKYCIDNNYPVYPISVNVSRNHIKDKLFINKFMGLIKKYEVPQEYLELEVTESIFVEDKRELKYFIDKIKENNLKVSIDDFGTAYSSLQTLTDVNVDILKIDKGFLDNINLVEKDIESKDKILIKNIINLAKELEFTVICEGVETEEQIELLKNIGCELGQGYVFAKPMSIEDYQEKFIKI